MMKRIRSAFVAAGVVAGAYAAAIVWWRMWMDNGIPGPPPYLHWFIRADGEASYVLTELEMFGVCVLSVCIALATVHAIKRRRQNKAVQATFRGARTRPFGA
jgi:hypothetical protein